MKKYILSILAAVSLSLIPQLSFAMSLSASPTSATSSLEGSVSFTFSGQSDNGIYLFSPTGTALSASANCLTSSPQNWSATGMPTGNDAGNYTVLAIGWSSCATITAHFNGSGNCTTGGGSYSACINDAETNGYSNSTSSITFPITSSGGGSSTTPTVFYYDNTVFNDLVSDLIWGLLAGILIAPFWLILDRRKKGRKNNPTL